MPTPGMLELPNLPMLPSYENVLKTLQTPLPSMESIIPDIRALMAPTSETVAPWLAQIKEQTNTGMADLASLMGQRGLAGSSIEAFGLSDVLGKGQQATSQFLGGIAQNSQNVLADLMFKARAGDQAALQQMITLIGQAMGGEVTAQRDMDMFRQQLEQLESQSKRSFWSNIIGGGLQAGASAFMGGR